MKILGKFYLTGGQIVEDEVSYKKASKEVSNKDFQKEIEKIVEETKIYLSEEIVYRSTKLFSFGQTFISPKDILAFQILISEEGCKDFEEFLEEEEENVSLVIEEK